MKSLTQAAQDLRALAALILEEAANLERIALLFTGGGGEAPTPPLSKPQLSVAMTVPEEMETEMIGIYRTFTQRGMSVAEAQGRLRVMYPQVNQNLITAIVTTPGKPVIAKSPANHAKG